MASATREGVMDADGVSNQLSGLGIVVVTISVLFGLSVRLTAKVIGEANAAWQYVGLFRMTQR